MSQNRTKIRKPKMPGEQYRRRKQREDRRQKGGNTRNWPTRPREEGEVRKINVDELAPAERERYGFGKAVA
jgi:hypothetical protein